MTQFSHQIVVRDRPNRKNCRCLCIGGSPEFKLGKNMFFQIKAKKLDLSYWRSSGAGSPLVYTEVSGPRNTYRYSPSALEGYINPSLLPVTNNNTAYSPKENTLNISSIFEP